MANDSVSVPVKSPPEPGKWTKEILIDHIKTGMFIELSVIPIYLCAIYSIKLEPGDDSSSWPATARLRILSVVEQEMLHLSLAGNMLRALNGTQTLYNKEYIPTYPSTILYDDIPMELRPADKQNLDYFLQIEAPYLPSVLHPPQPGSDEYNSIGKFYSYVKGGIEELWNKDKGLFSSNEKKQFTGAEFFDSEMTVITNKDTAFQALSTIVDQGEGSIGIPDSHYAIFVDLYQNLKRWNCFEYIAKPKTESYTKNPVAYRLSLAVNASYCYLLQIIDKCWETEDQSERLQLVRKLHKLMIDILSPCASILVKQTIEDPNDSSNLKHAAPCFEFYPPDKPEPLPANELRAALKKELDEAHANASEDNTKTAITKILFSLQSLD
ncbi:hypothetical protein GYMLUDRAFT_241920 [Collybiopsis luxurians FD-317 M1]|uniref:Iminophenyl-pyruvate dimer synthase domain-containing protein n=1 Tax=Collybiopsis luxurians FD-317 M1 TaxID=944289 RepID=A0A0D0D2K5_9AGAR|nr:hypothetical protein GYMLUDRAFT_241920 [Collybiopsis luxurians FD-317 M1]